MKFSQTLKLLSLMFMGIVFSTPTLACGIEIEHKITVREAGHQQRDCIALTVEFPAEVGSYGKPAVWLEYKEGRERVIRARLQEDHFDNTNKLRAASFCLTEALLKHANIIIFWSLHRDGEIGLCPASSRTGNLDELLKAGGTIIIKPFQE